MTDTPTIRRAQFRGVTLSRDDLVAEAGNFRCAAYPGLSVMHEAMADFAMMIAARVALRMALPPGYVVVPREPTEAMCDMGAAELPTQTCENTDEEAAAEIYCAMIAAATKESEG